MTSPADRSPLSQSVPCSLWSEGAGTTSLKKGAREVVVELPIAIVFNGTTAAVMMASPADIADFALGFAMAEGYVSHPDEVLEFEEVAHDRGIEARFWLVDAAAEKITERRRTGLGPMGCGLCGIDSLSQALRPLPVLNSMTCFPAAQIANSTEALRALQPLQDQTRSAHAAGFMQPGVEMQLVREDVGRHNAMDKLAGALLRNGLDIGSGAIVLTSRLSVDLVQKAAVLGVPVLIGASAPSALAIDTAQDAGITLVGQCKHGRFETFTHGHRINI